LTINPQTGLPEAGFLSSILPMVGAGIGIALAPATGGTSLYALGGGALGGMLGSSMEGKSPLMGAISGGVSGYMMGGVGEGLAQAGAAGGAEGLNASAEMAFKNAQVDKAMLGYSPYSPEQLIDIKNAGEVAGADVYKTALESTPNLFPKMSPEDLAKNLASPERQNIIKADYLGNMGKGLQELSSGRGFNDFIGTAASKGVPATGLGGGMSAAMKGVGLAAPMISSALTPAPFTPPAKIPTQYARYGDSTNPGYRPPEYDPRTGNYNPASYGPVSYSTNPTQYGAEGGAVGYASGGVAQPYRGGPGEDPENSSDIYSPGVSLPNMAEARADKMTLAQLERAAEDADTAPEQAAATKRLQLAMAKLRPAKSTYLKAAGGGLMGLNTYAAGGKLLRGPGDGMSDSIPAVIQGAKPQRAALADGEFVIPADVVSHLGNGSTEAGSKRLYSMMDKVRRARTGNPKQGKQINPNRFLPA
jgi:hypothetical protein